MDKQLKPADLRDGEKVKLVRLQLQRDRLARRREKEQRDAEIQRMVIERLLLNPNVIRVGLAAAIIAHSTWATRSAHNVGPVHSALALAGPTIGIPLIAADAGIKDKYALAAIAGMGGAYAGLSALKGWEDAGVGWGLPEMLQRAALGPAFPLWEYLEDAIT